MSLGRVARLRRYPVKSMKGEDLDSALLLTSGMVGDRLYAFLDENRRNETKFPWGWITARQVPELLLFEPKYIRNDVKRLEFLSNQSRMNAEVIVSYLAKKYSLKVSLKFDERGNFDSKPISLLGLSTLRQLETESFDRLDPERFRANIYAEWEDQRPFYEDDLVGKTLIMGKAKIKILRKNSRCSIPTLDPKTAKATPKIQENITRNHGGFTGVYASVLQSGEVNVGDEIISE
ncbi:MAG: MOSC domain-containing protein [Nitrososphaerales archaeon]